MKVTVQDLLKQINQMLVKGPEKNKTIMVWLEIYPFGIPV